MNTRDRIATALGIGLVVIGVALLVQTAEAGGGLAVNVGYVMGVGLVIAGIARLWVVRIMRRNERVARGEARDVAAEADTVPYDPPPAEQLRRADGAPGEGAPREGTRSDGADPGNDRT